MTNPLTVSKWQPFFITVDGDVVRGRARRVDLPLGGVLERAQREGVVVGARAVLDAAVAGLLTDARRVPGHR